MGSFWKIPDVYALQHQSLDAYLYLRYLRMALVLCFVGCIITWPVLFPVNATGGGGQTQLDILSYANINQATQNDRYYAHVFVGWLYFGFIMYLIMRECIFYINLRQAFLLSPFYADRISSRTVLFTSVPEPYLNEAGLRKIFGNSVRRIWMTADTDEVDKLVEDRDKAAMRLEKAEVKLIKLANAERQKAIKAGTAPDEAAAKSPASDASVADRWVPKDKRPTHRLGPLGLFGKKVDTIDWCRAELERLIPEVDAAQAKYRAGGYKKIPGVFIEFNTQADAEGASQILAHHQGLHMTPKYIGIRPGEVLWKSLAIPWWQKVIRRYAVVGFITAMILFWAVPVAFVGLVSNVTYLAGIEWLRWLKEIPPVIMGVITGLLPSIALSILMALVPIVMRCRFSFSLYLYRVLLTWNQCVQDWLESRRSRGSSSSRRTPTSPSRSSRSSWSPRSRRLLLPLPSRSSRVPRPPRASWRITCPRRPTSTFPTLSSRALLSPRAYSPRSSASSSSPSCTSSWPTRPAPCIPSGRASAPSRGEAPCPCTPTLW